MNCKLLNGALLNLCILRTQRRSVSFYATVIICAATITHISPENRLVVIAPETEQEIIIHISPESRVANVTKLLSTTVTSIDTSNEPAQESLLVTINPTIITVIPPENRLTTIAPDFVEEVVIAIAPESRTAKIAAIPPIVITDTDNEVSSPWS